MTSIENNTKTLNIRGVPRHVAEAVHQNAAARGMKIAEYLEALVRLHEAAKESARGDQGAERALMELGLHEIVR